MNREELKMRENEEFIEYCSRLYRSKIELGLTNKEIYEVIKKETDTELAESSVRCKCADYNVGFNDGFEKALSDSKDNSNSEYLKELEEKKLEIEKERKKLQATKIELNKNLRKESRFELFYENIRDEKDRLPLPKFNEIELDYNDDGSYALGLADLHYGANFKSENNEYSREECKRRFEVLLWKVKRLINKNDIKHLTIIEGGDTIQGLLRISDVSLNDIPVVDSVIEVSRLIATFLNELSRDVRITYRHTMGANHSQCRYLGTKANEMPKEDMEHIIGNYIKDLVSNNERIEVKLSDKDYDSFTLEGQNILTMHGHQVKNVKNAIRDYGLLHKKFYDICFLAHFHAGQSMNVGETNGNTEIIVLPSFVGSDPYSDSLKVGSKAMCKLFKIEENQGITETYTIILN